ncbi:p-nitrophenyl phosphatase [Balamuthia mandrillaris]
MQKLADVEAFLKDYDTFLIDCDGVLWRGAVLLPNTKEVLSQLRQRGKRLIFVTNNSTKSREQYKSVFAKFDIEVAKEEIVSSSYAAAYYLSSHVRLHEKKQKVYLMGESGVAQELEEVGIEWVGGEAHKEHKSMPDLAFLPVDDQIGAVLVGFDGWINYHKLAYAMVHLTQNKECMLVATNRDLTFPSSGHLLPGGGTMVAAVEACSGRVATTVGKPAPILMELILERFELDKARTCMIGDRLDTDIQFGNEGGVATLLVLTGVTTKEAALSPDNSIRPTYYTDAFQDLLLPSSSSS